MRVDIVTKDDNDNKTPILHYISKLGSLIGALHKNTFNRVFHCQI